MNCLWTAVALRFYFPFLCLSHISIFKTQGGKLSLSLGEYGKSTSDLQHHEHQARHVSLAPGLTYVIQCSSNDHDFLSNPWTRNQSNINVGTMGDGSSPRVFFTAFGSHDRDLYLYSFESSLSGEYSCHSAKETASVVITAKNPSVVINWVHFDRLVHTSNPFIAKLLLYGDPVPTLDNITWYFDGNPIDETYLDIMIEKIPTGHLFHFPRGFKKKQTGLYTAVVSTSAGTSNDSFTLQVFTHPVISFSSDCNCLSNNKITVAINSSFTLSCQEQNSDPLPMFTWFRDGRKDPEDALIPNSHMAKENVSPNENRLIFSDILPEHAGMYYCKANNTRMKSTKGIIVTVQYPPKVTAVSPHSIAVLAGEEIRLLVKYTEGFPASQANWSHYNGNVVTSILENSRISLNDINLTISNATISDGGLFILEVGNTVKTVRLDFNVSVLVSPTLLRVSNSTVYCSVGGTATFIVGVADSYPRVSIGNLVWSGNFNSNQQRVTFEKDQAKLVLTDLQLTNSGCVTLTVKHPGGNIRQAFQLIVLIAPEVPDSISVTLVTACLVEISWKISKPLPNTAPIDEVIIEKQTCSIDDTTCDKEWSLLRVCPSHIQSASMLLLPNKDYNLRLTGCSGLVGCGRSLILIRKISSNLQASTGSIPKVTNVSLRPLNASSIQITWNETTTECYQLAWHTVKCWNSKDGYKQVMTNVSVSLSSTSYTAVLTDLEADNEYNCTVVPVYNDLFGNTALVNAQLAYDIGHTYPRVPSMRTFQIEIGNTGNRIESGTIILINLSGFDHDHSISHIHIIVLRLGNTPAPSLELPDKQYVSLTDFSTYESVHLEGNSVNYQPYVAAEFNAEHMPDYFLVGGGRQGGNAEDLREHDFSNGPLNTSDYYTVFIRFYARSQFGKQYNVFTSSNFSSPVKPATGQVSRSSSSSGDSNSVPVVAGSVTFTLMVLLIVLVAAMILIKIAHTRKRSRK